MARPRTADRRPQATPRRRPGPVRRNPDPRAPAPQALAAALAAGLLAGPAAAGEDLGAVTGVVDGTPRDWRVPEGVFVTPDRAAATWERVDAPAGQAFRITLEAGDPGSRGHAGAGLVSAMLLAGPEPTDVAEPLLGLVGDWPADARTPDFVYYARDGVAVSGVRLEPPRHDRDRLHLEVTLEARLCAQDMDARPIDPPGAPRCIDVALQVATAALPHDMVPQTPAPDLRATPPATATATPPATATATAPGATPDRPSGGATLEVLGTMTGRIGGSAREWLTLRGEIRGEEGATAFWRRTEFAIPGFADTLGGMLDGLPEAERGELAAQMDALDGLLRGDGPVAGALEGLSGTRGGVHRHLDLTIGGHDPDSSNILTDGTLTLQVALPDGPVAPDTPLPAAVTYVVEGGSLIPQLFYVSGEDGGEGSVTFDRLALEPGGGHAAGRFEATLCRMEAARLREGADLSDCIEAEGTFDTALGEDTGP